MIVTGLREVVASFVKAATTAGPRSTEATRKAAHDIADVSKTYIHDVSGDLARSIEVTEEGEAFEVGPTMFYGAFVEDGTAHAGPKPFMQPATDQVLPRWVKLLGNIGTDL